MEGVQKMEMDFPASGESYGTVHVCRLCFSSESSNPDIEFRDIAVYNGDLDIFFAEKLLHDANIPQVICRPCVDHIEGTRMLQKRVEFASKFWAKYLNQMRRIPLKEEKPAIHTDVLLNCHVCGMCCTCPELLAHLVSNHGTDHVPECDFCKVFLGTKVIMVTEEESLEMETHVEMEEEVIEEDDDVEEDYDDADVDEDEGEEEDYKPDIDQISEEEIDDEDYDSDDNERLAPSNRVSCDLCEKTYSNMNKVRTHKRTVHKIHPLACLTCYDRFSSSKELNSHIHSTHRKPSSESRRFNCNYCSMSFKYENKLKRHLRVHPAAIENNEVSVRDAKPRFPCTACESTFHKSFSRDQHMEKIHEKAFICEQCTPPIGYATRAELKAHQSELHSHKCELCVRTLRSDELYKVHMKGHQQEMHGCQYCDKAFPTKELLNEHRKRGHQKPQRCPICHEVFEKDTLVNQHISENHDSLICGECHVEFPTLKGLKLHDVRVHKATEQAGDALPSAVKNAELMATMTKRPFQCAKCDASFKSKLKLERHLVDRHEEEGYRCDVCEKMFESKSKLRQHSYKHNMKLCGICGVTVAGSIKTHMRRHTDDKPFKCNFEGCNKQFPRNSDLFEHTKVHTGEKPFPCQVCGMRFTRKNKVTVHMRTHTGDKPYKCTFQDCTREFAQSFDLTLHMRRHTGEKPYECEICGERFILTSLMKSHKINCAQQHHRPGSLGAGVY